MQATWVQSLVWEDPTSHGATKHHSTEPTHPEPVLGNKRSPRSKKPAHPSEEEPLLAATRESPREAVKTQCSQKWVSKF